MLFFKKIRGGIKNLLKFCFIVYSETGKINADGKEFSGMSNKTK